MEKRMKERKKAWQDDVGSIVSDFVRLPPSRLQYSLCVDAVSETASNRETLSLHQTEVRSTHSVCAWLSDRLRCVGNSPLCRDTLGKMNGKYAAHFYCQCICFLLDRHCTHSLWHSRELLAPFFFERSVGESALGGRHNNLFQRHIERVLLDNTWCVG